MAIPTIYRSDDADAPILDGLKGSLINVLKACLVDGYGDKSSAGWTLSLHAEADFKAIFQNDTITGSGRYFRVQDNGRVVSGSTTYHNEDRPCVASICGMHSYDGADNPAQPFPRVIAGGDYHNSNSTGVTIRKRYNNNGNHTPWMVVADNRTCYLFTVDHNVNTKTWPQPNSSTSLKYVNGFGDVKAFNPTNTIVPKAFVLGGFLSQLDASSGGIQPHNGANISFGLSKTIYFDRSLEVGNKGVQGGMKGLYFSLVGGKCRTPITDADYMRYPSPGNFGVELNPIVLSEYTNDDIRTHKWAVHAGTEFGLLPGLYGCPHTTTSESGNALGAEMSTITQDGKTLLLYSQNRLQGLYEVMSELLAIDTGDWWI